MTITYTIHNSTSELVKTVMLRKFFQMTFVSDDRKALHIYTATVIGASPYIYYEENSEGTKRKPEDFLSRLSSANSFRMRFEFAVAANDHNEVLNITHEDITETTKDGFLEEEECIRQVWGTRCSVFTDDQEKIHERLKILYENISEEKKDFSELVSATGKLCGKKLLWTEQQKGGMKKSLLTSLSIPGKFEIVDEPPVPRKRDEISYRSAYTINVPSDLKMPDGIELVNWVITTIEFKYPLNTEEYNYVIKKDNTEQSNYALLCPDFTWYFAPPVKTFIDSRNSMVELKRGKTGGNVLCACPIKQRKDVYLLNDKYQNSINTVPNKLTVNFSRWDKDEKINARQKYRLSAREILPNPETISDISEIDIYLDMSDEHNRGNRQFILGLFISFALSFGIDSGRLQEISKYFPFITNLIPLDVWWISFLVLFSLVLMNKPAVFAKHERGQLLFRKVLIYLTMVWTGIAFGVLRSPIVTTILEGDNIVQTGVSYFMMVTLCVLIIGQGIYLRMIRINKFDNLFVRLFGDDIL